MKPGCERPVIIHRAILGSLERFIAILTEHLGGKWPLWLSPRQIIVLPISEKFTDYANQVVNELKSQGFIVEIETQGSISKRIREAEMGKVNYQVVIGQKEQERGVIEIRSRDKDAEVILLIL